MTYKFKSLLYLVAFVASAVLYTITDTEIAEEKISKPADIKKAYTENAELVLQGDAETPNEEELRNEELRN